MGLAGGTRTQMRRDLARVLCIFPFEEAYFEGHGVPATYIGHPLTWTVRASTTKVEFFRKHDLDPTSLWLPAARQPGRRSRSTPPPSIGCRGEDPGGKLVPI